VHGAKNMKFGKIDLEASALHLKKKGLNYIVGRYFG